MTIVIMVVPTHRFTNTVLVPAPTGLVSPDGSQMGARTGCVEYAPVPGTGHEAIVAPHLAVELLGAQGDGHEERWHAPADHVRRYMEL